MAILPSEAGRVNRHDPNMELQRHAAHEDALAILMGTLFIAVGVMLYSQAKLVTGGTAGLGLLLHHASGAGFWLAFSAVNVPFYALAAWRMGWKVALRTFLAVTVVSLFAKFLPNWIVMIPLDPVFATILGGGLMGNGLLMLFRHRTALGGVNILAMFLQEKFGWRAGYVQLGIDCAILLASLAVLPPQNLALSLLGAVVVNLILAINHRPGRYLGMS
ncbi:MAG: YitT family protein [Methylobacterium sp.]|jgi:uncharacterized membrane-anchored protein YitT (DUF2179 family)|nr:YitT family protein [Methylobacterium sp.]